MSIIKITGSGAYEHTQETNHSLEYLKRTLTEHKIKPTLDHPDGSVTKEKLSSEIRDTLELNSSSLTNHEVRVKKLENESHTHTNKDVLDTITAGKTAKWDSYEATIAKEKNITTARFNDIEEILSLKADSTEVLDKQPSDFIIHAEYVDSDDTNPSIRTNSTFAELSEAYNNGRNIRVLLGNINLSMSSSNSINFTFSCIYNGKEIIVTCSKWNKWLCEHIVHIDLIKSEVQSKENELIEVLDEVLYQQENYSDTEWSPPIHPVFPSPSEPSIPDIDFEI